MAVEIGGRTPPAAPAAPPALRFERASVRLGEPLARREIDFAVQAGAFVGLIGPNGSAKNTLLRAALGVVPLADGRVEVEGLSPDEARDAFAYLPQRPPAETDLPRRAWGVVLMGR